MSSLPTFIATFKKSQQHSIRFFELSRARLSAIPWLTDINSLLNARQSAGRHTYAHTHRLDRTATAFSIVLYTSRSTWCLKFRPSTASTILIHREFDKQDWIAQSKFQTIEFTSTLWRACRWKHSSHFHLAFAGQSCGSPCSLRRRTL